MTACPSDELLSRFVGAAASREEREAVERHIDSCATCAEVVAEIARTWFTSDGAATRPTGQLTVEDAGARGELAIGVRLGRYDLGPRIGAGGMGTVYAASDPVLRRSLAVKVIKPSAADAGDDERLLREARAMARVSNPNVVVVHDAGRTEDGARVFVAMELVRGPSLRRYLAAHPSLGVGETLRLFADAARGLGAAHEAGVVHRDFKPENVLVELADPPRAKVTDFGLACAPAAAADEKAPASLGRAAWLAQSTTDGTVGTPAYMAPEQIDGRVPDAGADQYAFGVALYEALWKHHPYGPSSNLGERREAIRRGPATPQPRADVPRWLWPVVRRAMSDRPGARFPTMAALVGALEQGEGMRAAWMLTAHALALFVMGCVHLLTLAFIVWSLTMPEASDDASIPVLGVVAGVIFMVWALAGMPIAFIASYGVARRRPWAYVVASLYALAGLPTGVGTPYAVFAFLTLRRPEVRRALAVAA